MESRDFRLWWLALLGMGVSLQMLEVAIGWEVYAQHRSALDLGWIGLAEFVPLFLLALPAGHLADVVPRRLIFAGSLVLGAAVGVGLALTSGSGDTSVVPYLALAVVAGTARALGTPASRAMPPTLVGAELLQSAMTLRSIATQSAQVVGPALGGLLYGTSPSLVYLLAAGACAAAFLCALAIRPARAANVASDGTREAASVESVLEGRSSWDTPRSCSGRSCSTCSPSCSAGRSRCCRSSRARSCTSGRPGSGCCGRRPRSGRCSAPPRSPGARSAAGPGACCSTWC